MADSVGGHLHLRSVRHFSIYVCSLFVYAGCPLFVIDIYIDADARDAHSRPNHTHNQIYIYQIHKTYILTQYDCLVA